MKPKTLRAFTLIELLILIMIIGILAAMIAIVTARAAGKARDGVRKHDIDLMSKGVREYYIDKKEYSSSLDTLQAENYIESLPEDPKFGPAGYLYTNEVVGGNNEVKICALLEVPLNPGGFWCWRSVVDSAGEVDASVASFASSPFPTSSPGGSGSGGGSPYGVVPVIYLAADTPLDETAYKDQVNASFEAIRSWYAGQLSGKTFNLEPAIFFRSSKTAAELASQYPGGGEMWFAGVHEAASANGYDGCDSQKFYYFVTPLENTWGGMVGAESLGCGYVLPGTASIPGHMGRLIGGIFDPAWPEWWADEIREAEGAAAHEIGHGLGGDCTNGNFYPGGGCNGLAHSARPSIMFAWWDFNNPNPANSAVFFDDEKQKVLLSPFIQ